MDKYSYVMNNDCVLLSPQISINIVNFSYRQPKFCKQPLVSTDNSQKQEKSIYLSFEHTMQVCESNGLTKISGTLVALEKSLIDKRIQKRIAH